MPVRRLRQPHRVAIDILNPLAILAAAFVLLWAVVLQPVWEKPRKSRDLGGPPPLAFRPTTPD